MGSSLNKIEGITLKNNSGVNVNRGDVVVIDNFVSDAFTVTGSSQLSNQTIGVVLDTGGILSGGSGLIGVGGYIPLINLVTGANLGDTIGLSAIAQKAQSHSIPLAGDFGQTLSSGLTPDAVLWGGSAKLVSHDYYSRLAALLEPDCLEIIQTGTFSYVVGANQTKYVIASWATKLGAAGRWEVRNPAKPAALRGVTLGGIQTTSVAITLDPSLVTYANPMKTYFDRLKTIDDSQLLIANLLGPQLKTLLLPGPYGSIITRVVNFDFTWIIAGPSCFVASGGWNLANENGDAGSTDYQRNDNALLLPISKKVMCRIESGQERTAGAGIGTVSYVILPSTWSGIPDNNVYQFRDDFMASSLDGTKWSSTGTVAIDTNFQWCKLVGDGTWGDTGLYSKTPITRANGRQLIMDVFPGTGSSSAPNLVVGFSDGLGDSYINLSHGIDFTVSAGNKLQIFENGNSRGITGSGWTSFAIYRIRITLGGSNNATYEIQGGPEYPPIGGTVWQNITPGTSSSSTTPVYAGAVQSTNLTVYIGDVKVL